MTVTYGEPRVGNQIFATFVDNVYPFVYRANMQQLVNSGKIVRVTHGNDPVVQIPFAQWGFRHHGVRVLFRALLTTRANIGSTPITYLRQQQI
jgi:hypothetical protein